MRLLSRLAGARRSVFIPHWQDNSDPPDGDAEDQVAPGEEGEDDRMYPVCFKRDTKMQTSVEMVLKPIEAFGSNLKIKGDRADSLDIPATPATAGDDKATITNATCEAAFPNYVTRYDTLDIVWSLSTDGGQTWQEVGTSKNETFITLDDPECDTLYRTVAYLATGNAGAGVDTEGEALDKTWGMFSSGDAPADVCGWNEQSRQYDRPLHYYQHENGLNNTTVSGLLQDADGQCHAWAELLKESWLANGVSGLSRTRIRPPVGYTRFAVKNIVFDDENPAFPDDDPWKYSRDDLDVYPPPEGAAGIPGQNMSTPTLKLFERHFLSSHTVVGTGTAYYDPSYGITTTGAQDYTQKAVAAWEKDIGGVLHWRRVGTTPAAQLRFNQESW
ncbi:MAG: hypothetical protein R6X33_04615 [Candidatus Brocadiia bacterium]